MILDTQISEEGVKRNHSATALTDGGFVVTWDSIQQDGHLSDVYGQRYDANGNTQGTEFRVNSYKLYSQTNSSVTALTDGGFVATWSSDRQDGIKDGIYGQRYDVNGNMQGAEFRVNSYINRDQSDSSVTALTDGGFVVTWTSDFQDDSFEGIYGQRYDANGNTQGAEFRVNSTTKNSQSDSSVTALTDGGFVATWSSHHSVRSKGGIDGQRYDANGNMQGVEFRVNSSSSSTCQLDSSVTALIDGGFVATWGSGADIYGQRYDANGNMQGAEFRVNSYTKESQHDSSVTALADGGFVVTWTSLSQDGHSSGVYGQRYEANGNMQGAEFRVNSFTTDSQSGSSVTALADGGFVVIWKVTAPPTFGIYGKRYDANGNEIEWAGNYNAASKTPTDTPNNNDRLISADSGLALDLDGSAGNVAKLIGAVFGAESVSNASYVATGLYYLDNGTSYEDLAAEAITFTDAKTPEQVTSLLWENVMGSAPSANDVLPYIDMLNSGTSVGELGVLAADSLKNQANIDLVGLSDIGIAFDPLHYMPVKLPNIEKLQFTDKTSIDDNNTNPAPNLDKTIVPTNSKTGTIDANPDGHVSSPIAKWRAEQKKSLSLESAESMLPVTDDDNNSDPAPSFDLTSNLFL